MSEVAIELEAIYEALNSPRATYEERKVAFEAFERLKIQEQSFNGAREAVVRRKSEGSVYTALLIIEHHVRHHWDKLSKTNNIEEFIIDIIKKSAEMNTNLVSGGAANVAYSMCLSNPKSYCVLLNTLTLSGPLCTEIFFLLLEKIINTVTDYCKNIRTNVRLALRESISSSSMVIFSVAYDRINIAVADGEPSSFRVISNIFYTLCLMVNSDLLLSNSLFQDEDLCKNYLNISFVLLDKLPQKYQEHVISFLHVLSDKLLSVVGRDRLKKTLLSDDNLFVFSSFMKLCSSISSICEGASFFANIARIITETWDSTQNIYSEYIFDILGILTIHNDPLVNVVVIKVLHTYSNALIRAGYFTSDAIYEKSVDLFLKLCINSKKCEYYINFNSVSDDNRLFKECEMIIYRYAMSVFTHHQSRAILACIKYGSQLITQYLYEDTMKIAECSGIIYALTNISFALDISGVISDRASHQRESLENIKEMSQLMLSDLIKAPIRTLRHFACFVDLCHCLLQYLSLVPTLWGDLLKTIHSHTLGFIKASKEVTQSIIDLSLEY
ncbi:hypothetical protein RF11_11210 [Thelohanellus kitauei]|uniref:Uncharacterized protein n=1 Tax=Thelohanellus kitauei TaxID=669202 RepID=A0A0C2MJ58_THEKT|nr:hypothetical protein RF11_11210 [Thelohanellus kitauei]